jgi:uncharacterized protein YbcI
MNNNMGRKDLARTSPFIEEAISARNRTPTGSASGGVGGPCEGPAPAEPRGLLSQGELEARFTEAMIKFERDFMGRGPSEVKSHIIDDMVLVRFKGIITRAEHHLAAADASGRGRDLIKHSRMELMEKARPLLDEVVQKELGRRIISLHTDISVKSGERIVVFVLDRRVRG